MKKKSESAKNTNSKVKSDQEITEWKKRFELIAEASGQIVYDYCLWDGSITWGGSLEKVLGYKLSEMKGGIKQWDKLIHKEDKKNALRSLEIAEKNLSPYEVEYRYKHKDGHYVDFLDRGYFVSFPEKNCTRMIGTMQDITEKMHSRKLIEALNSAVLNVQKVISRHDIFKTVAEELKKLGINSMILIPDDELKNLSMEYYSYDSKLMKRLEKIAGAFTKDVKLSIENINEYQEVVHNNKTLLIINSEEFVRQVLPKGFKFMTKQILKTFNIDRFILSPLVMDDKFMGILSVQSNDFIESDIPTITIFAHQLAGAWHKGELIERIQQDISIQKQTEKTLTENEQKYRTIVEQLSDGFALMNSKGEIIEWNKTLENITGRKRENAVNKLFWDVQYEHTLPEFQNDETYKRYKRMAQSSLIDKNFDMFNVSYETPILDMNGNEHVIQTVIFPILIGDDFFVGNMTRDITEKIKVENAIQESEETLRTFINALPYPAFLLDENHRILICNDSLASGFNLTQSEILGENIFDFLPKSDAERRIVYIREVFEKGKPLVFEDSRDGFHYINNFYPIFDERKKVTKVAVFALDITSRLKAERENVLLAQAIKSVKDAVSITDMDNNLIFVNDAFLEMYGYEENEVIGKHISFIVSDKNPSDSIVKVKEGTIKGNWYGELINKRKDNSEFPIELWTSVVKDVNNDDVAMVGVARDITDRKKAEKEILEKSKELDRYFTSSLDLLCIADTDGYFRRLNPEWERILGFSREELFKGKFLDFIHPDDLELTLEAVKTLAEQKEVLNFTNRYKCKDGTYRWLEWRSFPEGELIYAVARDITESILAEKALKESEEKMQSIYRVAPTGIGLVKDRVLLSANPRFCEITGYSEEELVGKNARLLYATREEYDYVGEVYYKQIAEKGIGEIETKWRKKSGEMVNVILSLTSIDSKDASKGSIYTALDITERKRAEEELIIAKEKAEEMSRVKSSFLANMSHEVRTPLVAILGFSEVLSDLVKDDELKNYVEMIHKGGERLLDTLNLILDLSIIESQKVKIELSPLDIVREVKDVVSLFEKAAERKNIRIESVCKEESIIISLDVKMLRQIMNNLINNAIKYTNSGCVKVKINKEKKDQMNFIAIRVEDTGIGIPEDKRDLIWEEFRQVSEGLNRSFEGAGLGLSITKKFVEKLDGKIFLERSEVDVGSTFTVMFPMKEELEKETIDISADTASIKTEIDNIDENLPVILYVEDDPIAIDIVKAFSRNLCILESASTGQEGIEKAKRKVYNAILMDINLGLDMNGLQATKIIKEIPDYKNIPIVAITAFAMIGDKEEFYEYGCTHYISKPFTKLELIQLIKEVIEKKE